MLDIINEAGWPIWLNIIASIVAVAIIFEKFWSLRSSVCVPAKVEEKWQVALATNPISIDKHSQDSMMDRIIYAGAKLPRHDKQIAKEAMQSQALLETVNMERYLTTLGTVAAMAPLMGLLGTVIGMIEIFASQSPTGSDPSILARGISIALYNTAFGLIVAIPAMIFYRHFKAKINQYLTDAEVIANHILHTLGRLR